MTTNQTQFMKTQNDEQKRLNRINAHLRKVLRLRAEGRALYAAMDRAIQRAIKAGATDGHRLTVKQRDEDGQPQEVEFILRNAFDAARAKGRSAVFTTAKVSEWELEKATKAERAGESKQSAAGGKQKGGAK